MKALALLTVLASVTQLAEQSPAADVERQSQAVASGLILLAMAQASFRGTFTAISAASRCGTLTTLPSIRTSQPERVAAFVLDGIGRGLVAGMAATLVLGFVTPVGVIQPTYFALYAFATCLTLALLGILCGSRAWVGTQLTTYGGFLGVSLALPLAVLLRPADVQAAWSIAAHANPFFYYVDGFHYGMVGRAQASPMIGVMIACGLNSVLAVLCCRIVRPGRGRVSR
ncbi:ABC-2 transporter permease [Roseicella aquatilis]|uniref:ABC transporter permease n=1 Tax=Roseicella aquatilis TaxID=2527868 RepID=A0A4R4DRI1_9PROT|nr:hypothetical protein [Roseicella aquatilis]TCZ64987.1 hypothetical protein EXY23_06350 [Roseicella aquatilis]